LKDLGLIHRLLFACVRLVPVLLGAVAARAQDDHPTDKPIVVGSDFGLAPWMVRGPNGPEGFGVDLANDIARRVLDLLIIFWIDLFRSLP